MLPDQPPEQTQHGTSAAPSRVARGVPTIDQEGPELSEYAAQDGPSRAHVPVLAERCLDLLAPAVGRRPGALLVDATLGLGGHAELALERFPDVTVLGIDRDPDALDAARARLQRFERRFIGVHAVYDEIAEVVAGHGGDRADAVLFDLGVSSMQLDRAERGFAYSQDGPLDMRMDNTTGRTAADLLASESEESLRHILWRYGEEKFAGRIAAAIVARRGSDPLRSTTDLAELVRESIPAPARRRGGNPSKRTFQALRVAVNAELEVLTAAIPAAIGSLSVGGRIVVMAYQSLEDRIVKRALVAGASSSSPPGLPVDLPDHRPYLRLLTHGAEQASEAEVESNPRAASVRLRAAEVVRERGAA